MITALADRTLEDLPKNMSPALTRQDLLPLAAAALAGKWEGVPSSVRPHLQSGMSRMAGGISPVHFSGSIPSASSRTLRVSGSNKQIPVETSAGRGASYKDVAYRINPGRRSIQALTPRAAGTRVEGIRFPETNETPAEIKQSGKASRGTTNTPGKAKQSVPSRSTRTGSFSAPARLAVKPSGRMGPATGLTGAGQAPLRAVSETASGNSWNPPGASHTSPITRRVPDGIGGMGPFSGQNRMQVPAPGVQSLPPREFNRMDRINANYEQDKMALGEESPGNERMLAKMQSHSVGHAGGSGSQKKFNKNLFIGDVIDDLHQEA